MQGSFHCFGFFLFYSVIMDSPSIENTQKLQFLILSFSKSADFGEYLSQFLMLLYDCVPSLSQFVSIGQLLKKFLLLVMGNNSTTSLYSDTTRREDFLTKKIL